MTITLNGTTGINTPGVVNTAAGTVATTLSVTGVSTLTGGFTVGATAAPAFSVYKSGTGNTGFSLSTYTKILMDTETFDTNSNFDSTTNYRFTPTVAGYYQIQIVVASTWNTTQWTAFQPLIYKNGSSYKTGGISTGNTVYGSISVTDLISMNGTTDYIEFYVYAIGGSAPAYNQGSANTFASGFLARSA